MEAISKDEYVGEHGQEISSVDQQMVRLENKEKKTVRREKNLDRDMNDMVEYVKWVTDDLGLLRDRVRIAEKIVSDLKRTGEESVESLLTKLYAQSKYKK